MTHRRIVLAFVALTALVAGVRWTGAPMMAARSPLRTTPLSGQPIAAVADARTGHVFVTTALGGVSMLDAVTGAVARTVTVGVNAQALAVSDAALRVFVVDAGYGSPSYTVSVLNARTGAMLRIVHVAATRPTAIAVDDQRRRIFVVNAGPLNSAGAASGRGSVSVLDGANGIVLHTTMVGQNPTTLAVDGATGRVFVVNSGATVTSRGSVSILDAAGARVMRTVPVGAGAGAVVVDARTARAFVNTGAGVYVLDTRTGAVLRVIPADGDVLTLDAATDRVFAINYVSGALTILDARDGRVVKTVARVIPAGDNPIDLAVDGTHGHVVILADNADGGSISVLDARTGTSQRTLVMGSDPAAVAVDAHSGHVFVASAGDGKPRAAQRGRAVPPWLRWLPFLPQWTPPKAPGSIGMLIP